MNRQERYCHYLSLCAELPEGQEPIYHQFAKVACGLHADDELIVRGLEHMGRNYERHKSGNSSRS